MPFAKSKTNPFQWSRFSEENIATMRKPYHNGNFTSTNPRPYNYYKGRYNSRYNVGIELEAISTKQDVNLLPSNWIVYEEDGSLREKEREVNGFACEFVTHPIPNTIAQRCEQWEEVCNWMKRNEFKSWDYGSNICGLHIHIGREALGSTKDEQEENLGKLIQLYYKIDSSIKNTIFGRPQNEWAYDFRRYLATYRSIENLGGNVTREAFKMMGAEKNSTREKYHEINTIHKNTIEFRRGRGSIDAKRISMVVTFCCQLCNYVRDTKDITKLTQSDFITYIRGLKKLENNPLMEIIINQ